jgi:squalene-hopene/tetraprenyl-beta-curcumene cyclase
VRPSSGKAALYERVSHSVAHATDYLYRTQRADGGWCDRLSSSAIPTALGVLALARADRIRYRREVDGGLAWLRANQRLDGGWSLADADPPSDGSVTAFAIAALSVLDPDGSAQAIGEGMDYIDKHGGQDAIFPNIRTWRELVSTVWALEGLRDIRQQPSQPIEVMLLPARLRNRASIALPGVIGLGIGQSRVMPAGTVRQFARRLAQPRGLAWLRSVQAPDGGIEECPLMAAIVFMGLRTAGPDVGADIQQGCLDYLVKTYRQDGSWAIDRDLEIAVTAYAVHALAECGDVAAEPRLRPTVDWLLSTQWQEPFSALKLPKGGWAWAAPSGWPESEDTAVVLSTLLLLGVPREHAAIQLGLRWLLGRQNGDGSWSEWVRDSSMVHDGPCTGVTSHVLMALHQLGCGRGRRSPVSRAIQWLERVQGTDGAAPSLWFRDSTHGTAKVLEACAELDLLDSSTAAKASDWLRDHQRSDGSWPSEVVEGPPDGGTVEETAWAAYSLLRAGEPPWHPNLAKAIDWLVARQDDAGTWRPQAVGLYYDMMYYSSDLIAHTYALRTLGRWLHHAGSQE